LKRYRNYLETELEAAVMYSALAEAEPDPERKDVFNKLVDAELSHAERWSQKLGMGEVELRPNKPNIKVYLLKWAARLFGTKRVLPVLLRLEAKEIKAYLADPDAQDLADDERKHARILRDLARGSGGVRNPGGRLVGSGGRLRAGVLGVNDGLVSNFSLVMGVTGGTHDVSIVLLAGVAGLLAGAFSMAAGEYVSMRSQRDIYEFELEKEAEELREWPEEEEEELVLIYQAKGLSRQESEGIAKRVMADSTVALDTMAREELGLDPSDLGSPWGAAASSFSAFVVGAGLPLLPYIFRGDSSAVTVSAALSGIALVIVGSSLAGISGRNVLWGGLRMLLAGASAAAVTYGVGSLIGMAVIS
jgi:VIT1/CCC1 family predicted Fe2+/Mn2+ transporter